MSKEAKGISRRDFLKGAAAGALGVASIGILGACASTAPAADPTAAPTTAVAETTPAPTEAPAAQPAAETASERITGLCGPVNWLGEKPVISDADITETIESDVVVVGGGHSGLLAALGAVDEGATVSVIETQPWSAFVDLDGTGANMGGWYGEDIGHVNSQWLLDKGYGPYNTGEIAYEFVRRTMGRCNPDLIKAYVQNSGPMVDRMMDIYRSYEDCRKTEDGAVFTNNTLLGESGVTCDFSNMLEYPLAVNHHQYDENTQYPIQVGGFKTWPCNIQFYGHQGNNIEYFNKYICYYTQEHGATWYFEHTGVVLVQNDAGDVTGVIAEDVNNPGKYKKFSAKNGVVVAAGDFKGNAEMCWSLLNEQMEWQERSGGSMADWQGSGTRNGSGHKMMCWAGGMMETTPRGSMSFGGGPSGPWGSAPFLQLNVKGERFYNEAGVPCAGPTCNRQPSGLACYVTDKKFTQTMFQNGLDHGSGNYGWKEMYDAFYDSFMAIEPGNPEGGQCSGIFVAESLSYMKSTVFCANTLDELADFLGYEGDAKQSFLDSIAHYNELCYSEMGDTDYGKDKNLMIPIDEAPFYAGKGELGTRQNIGLVTLAGVVTDKNLRVMKGGLQDEAIKGLYTCGNCLGNRYGMGYVTPMAGNSVGMAMTHGYLAGKNAAKAL